MSQDFDPNGVGIANGNIFGFPVTESEAEIIILPVPWDATASYGKGTSNGPKAILEASTQLDFYHPKLKNAWLTKVFMSPISDEWKNINDELCEAGKTYIQFLEEGGKLENNEDFKSIVDQINLTQKHLRDNLEERATTLLNQGKLVAVLGGEHSTPFGLMKALDKKYADWGILQIDAHADLRDAYEGFNQSHASIMFNVLNECTNLKKLVQVGIRDMAQSEVDLIIADDRINTFFDYQLKHEQYEGKTWGQQVDEIISALPQEVYISFDIDGLTPNLCPNTGTPVVGGFDLEQVNYLFFKVIDSGRRLIGFDLNEVAPSANDDWDANVGARALWNLVCCAKKSLLRF
jgi:agmatinase